MMTKSDSDVRIAAERWRSELAKRLAPDGWIVESSVGTGSRFSISLQHPLTSDTSISADAAAESVEATFERFLANAEFEKIGRAPVNVPRARLIKAIRENAKGFEWPDSVIERVALVLRGEGVLTDEEADWLESAGPSWADDLAGP